MRDKKVKDLMISVDIYPTVRKDASVLDAILTLEKSQEKVPENLAPYRAVLVVDDNGKILGKAGHLAFLKAMEPKLRIGRDAEGDRLEKANLSPDILDTIDRNVHMWEDDYFDICSVVSKTKISEIMHPVEECVDENAHIKKAIHKIINLKTISLLVKKNEEVVGIIRLTDIYNELQDFVKNECRFNEKNSKNMG